MHELLKLLNEFDLNEVNNNLITRASYEEILFQYLYDMDENFNKQKFIERIYSYFYKSEIIFIVTDVNLINYKYNYKKHLLNRIDDKNYTEVYSLNDSSWLNGLNRLHKEMIKIFRNKYPYICLSKSVEVYEFNSKYILYLFSKGHEIENRFTKFIRCIPFINADKYKKIEINYDIIYCFILIK